MEIKVNPTNEGQVNTEKLREDVNKFKPAVFPEEYGHFDRVDSYVYDSHQLEELRDVEYYDEVYKRGWLALCMTIDKKNQDSLENNLKKQMIGLNPNTEEYKNTIGNYWENFKEVSVYPIYKKTENELRFSKYGKAVVSKWNNQLSNSTIERDRTMVTASKIYPYIYDINLISNSYGSTNNPDIQTVNNHFYGKLNEISKDEGIQDADIIKGYVASLQLSNGARDITLNLLNSQIRQFNQVNNGTLKIEVADWNVKFQNLVKKLEPYHYFAHELGNILKEKEKEMFGEDVEIASDLWRSTVFLRKREMDTYKSVNTIREPVIRSLLKKNYAEASISMKKILNEYPEALPDFMINKLSSNPKYNEAVLI